MTTTQRIEEIERMWRDGLDCTAFFRAIALLKELAAAKSSPGLSDDFERGYFCAVAVLLKENFAKGCSGTEGRSLFRQGGDWRKADHEDIQTLRDHGLIDEAQLRAVKADAVGGTALKEGEQ